MTLYRGGLERWHDWLTAPYAWLLLDAQYNQDIDHDTIADVADSELTDAGYARQAMSGPITAPFDTWYSGVCYGADRPAWTGLDGVTAVQWLVLAYAGPDDASAGLVAAWPFGPTIATDYTVSLAPWQDPNNNALPGGGPNTGLVHNRWIQR